jgi:hypothetical protein
MEWTADCHATAYIEIIVNNLGVADLLAIGSAERYEPRVVPYLARKYEDCDDNPDNP